jgi:hypothetical protein
MKPRIWGIFAALLWVVVLAPVPVLAQRLYAASVRSIAEGGADVMGGALYSVELSTGTSTFVAPIRLNGGRAIGITGLSVHPASAVFYGITSPLSRNEPFSLVTLDPRTGDARLIGRLRFGGSDISFNRAGILFTWLPGTSQLGVVNIETGEVTPIGDAGPSGPPAGLAIDANGVAYITAKGATGTLDTVDIATGQLKTGPPLTGAPFDSTINSMTFTPSGLLLAVNTNSGSPAAARLVTINTATGVISTIGNLPDDTDGLAFSADPPKEEVPTDWRIIALWVLAGIGAILAGVGWFVDRKPKPKA